VQRKRLDKKAGGIAILFVNRTAPPYALACAEVAEQAGRLSAVLVAADTDWVESDIIPMSAIQRIRPPARTAKSLLNPFIFGRFFFDVSAALKSSRASAVHLTNGHPSSALLWLLLRLTNPSVHRVATLHDAAIHPGERSLTSLASHRLDGFGAESWICLSTAVAEKIRTRRLFRKISPVVMAHPLAGYGTAVRRKRRTDERQNLIFAGRIEEYKGVDLLLGAAKLLKDKGLNFSLIIAGRNDKDLLPTQLDNPSVTLMDGWLPEQALGELIDRSGLMVAPYREASQSGVVAAALALGCPCVVTPVGGLTEQIQVGVNGLQCDSISAASLAECIQSVLADTELYDRIAEGAAQTVDSGRIQYASFLERLATNQQ
jgi:glycosyltransferase involved in cell wall biosynthesis